MAMTSGLYLATVKALTASGGIAGWTTGIESTGHRIRLHSDTYTPDHATETTVVATGEISGGSWSSGASNPLLSAAYSTGSVVPTWGVTGSGEASIITYKHTNNVIVATSNFTGATGCVIWADEGTSPANPMLVSVAFGGTASPNGTFTIQWHTNGVFTLDLIT